MWDLPLYKTNWSGKKAIAKVALRAVLAKLTGKHWQPSGAALQGRMFERALATGVDMRINAGVERILSDESGAVIGVQASVEGQARTFLARRGVLINAGGFRAQPADARPLSARHLGAVERDVSR